MHMKDHLNTLGLKATPQRLSLLALLDEYGHMTIETLYEKLKDDNSSLSLSTVYNNLSILRDKGIVREIAVSGSKQFFEVEQYEHAHFVCKSCGEILDLPVVKSSIKKLIEAPAGVVIDDADLVFSGVCATCREKNRVKRTEKA